ncbi:hypothetical protein AGLY_003281 [Aphis glycines]|uniref:Transposable element P transposase-like GTP-binding insertion domain-containing protein n=1 Tax=Aphis glycines TaxID=307491 RepID=A0A6G0U0W0_APHGL|nr:hypothetical protein AGLY_003281 [Aphis glycines]
MHNVAHRQQITPSEPVLVKMAQHDLTTKPTLSYVFFRECRKFEVNKQLYSKSKQLISAQGLTCSWKQPVFYDFQCPMTKDLLFDIISEIQNAAFEKNLDITPTSWFINPVSKKKVHVFADVPHLLKLARNHFIDKGFVLPENVYIGKNVLEGYLKISKKSEFELAFRFSEKHINVTGTLRQNMELATQVFSNRLAEALKYCGKKKYAIYASELIKLFNDCFDLLNTQLPIDKFTKSYGLDEDSQNELLKKMDSTIENMKVHGSKKRLPFQTGILVTNASLSNLLIDIKNNYNDISYIMTRRVTSDVLENLSFI